MTRFTRGAPDCRTKRTTGRLRDVPRKIWLQRAKNRPRRADIVRWLPVLALLSGALASSSCTAQSHSRPRPQTFGPLFFHVGDFPLGASVNRTDYESVDPVARRLYVAKMGGGQLLVFDIEHNRLLAQLSGFPKISG